jgi:hypothetical protein
VAVAAAARVQWQKTAAAGGGEILEACALSAAEEDSEEALRLRGRVS